MDVLIGICGSAACIQLPKILGLLGKSLPDASISILPTKAAYRFVDWRSLCEDLQITLIEDIVEHLNSKGILYSDYCKAINKFFILPTTGNSLAKIRVMIADNDLLSLAFAFDGPVYLYPCVHPTVAESAEFADLLAHFYSHPKFIVFGPTFGYQITTTERSYRYGALGPPHSIAADVTLKCRGVDDA